MLNGDMGARGRGIPRLGGLLALLALLVAVPSPARAQVELAHRISAALDDDAFADAFWGVLVQDLDTGETLYSHHADKRFIPASNLKLFTTAAALDRLGPAFRYTTTLFLDGEVRGGTLFGDLVIRGAGDPAFGAPEEEPLGPFRQWADSLRALGVSRIAGAVIGDDDVFDDVPYGLGWAWDDLAYGYGAEVSGLQFHEGTIEMSVRGTRPGAPARISWTPLLTAYVEVENRTITRARGTAVDEGYTRDLSGNRFVVTTEVPQGGGDTEALAVHNPTRYTADTFRLVLLGEGLAVEGPAVDVDDPGSSPGQALDRPLDYAAMTPVARHVSPPLAEIVEETNLRSQNLYAEHLLRTLGVLRFEGGGAPGSAEAGVAAMAPFLLGAGVDPEAIRLIDGSGLSFMNRVTPRQVVQVLAAMHRHADPAVRTAFYDSLPVGGESGTLSGRYRRGAARGNVRAKTGYINGVRTLSGYVTSAEGHRLAFALLCNGYSVPTARVNAAQDAVVELLAAYRGP